MKDCNCAPPLFRNPRRPISGLQNHRSLRSIVEGRGVSTKVNRALLTLLITSVRASPDVFRRGLNLARWAGPGTEGPVLDFY